MPLTKLLKQALKKPAALQEAQNISFGRMISYLILLSFFLAIPISMQVIQVFQQMRQDSIEIAETIPDFTIKNDKLTPTQPTTGYIYQTNSMIFTFDPEGKRTKDDIAKDMVGNFFSFGLLQDQLVLHVPATMVNQAILNNNTLSLPYKESALTHLTGEKMRNLLTHAKLPWWIYFLIVFIAIYPAFVQLMIHLLIGTLLMKFVHRLRKQPRKFMPIFKIMIASATIPVLLSTVMLIIFPHLAITSFIMFGSVLIYNFSWNKKEKSDLV